MTSYGSGKCKNRIFKIKTQLLELIHKDSHLLILEPLRFGFFYLILEERQIIKINNLFTIDSLAQLEEHNTFNVGVLGSSPRGITKEATEKRLFLYKEITHIR